MGIVKETVVRYRTAVCDDCEEELSLTDYGDSFYGTCPTTPGGVIARLRDEGWAVLPSDVGAATGPENWKVACPRHK